MKKATSSNLSILMVIMLLFTQLILVLPQEVEAVTVELANQYTSEEEFLFNPYFNRIDDYLGESTVVYIPPTIGGMPVETISGKAFFRDEHITKIVVPEGVKYIGEQAFYGCTNLVSLELPDSLTYIGYNTIAHTAMHEDASNWQGGCFYIGPYMLGLNTDTIHSELLEPVDIRVKSGTRIIALNETESDMIKRLYLPRSIEYIGREFELATDSVDNIKPYKKMGYIGNCLVGWYLDFGEYLEDGEFNMNIKPGTEVIPEAFFEEVLGIRSVTTPKSLKTVPYNCFSKCSFLEVARLPYVEKIQEEAFYLCDNLHTVQLSENLAEIDDGAFGLCRSLESIEIFEKVKKIGSGAFSECNSLNNIVIHEGVDNIEDYAFFWCDNLTDVYYTGSESSWKSINMSDSAFNSNVTIHYNHMPVKRSYEEPIYIPQTINEVTITGKGTAYGRYKVLDLWGNVAENMLVEYRVNDGPADKTYADDNGFIKVSVKGVEADEDFRISIGGVGIAPQEQILSVKVKPLTFKADYEAIFTKGGKAGVGIAAGVSLGKLKADATIAEVGISGSAERGISISQEYVGGKNKLTVSSKQNLEGALEAKAGLFAGLETDLGVNLKASAGEVSGNGSVGSIAGVSFEDDDFDINNKEDVEAVANYVLCSILDTMAWNNAVSREIINRLGFEINAYESGNTASLGAGASLGVIGITGDYTDAEVVIGGIDASSVWSNSTKTYSDGTVKYTSSLKAGTNGKVFDFGVKTKGDNNLSIGETIFNSEKMSNDVNLEAIRDNSLALTDLSFECTYTSNDNILWNKSSTESKHKITYPSESVETVTHQDWNLYSFSQGRKAFFSVDEWENAVSTMLNSGEKAAYNESKTTTHGFDFLIGGSGKLGIEIGGEIGISGVESYEYDSANGIYENGEVFVQSSNDISEEVADKVITVEKLMDIAVEKMQETLSELFDTISDIVDGAIDAGQQKLENIGNGINAAIKKTKEDLAPATVFAIGDTQTAEEMITVGNPCIIMTTDDDGNVISDFSDSPMLLTIKYTDEQLLASEISSAEGIKLMRWDEDLCVYVSVDAQHNETEKSFSAYITSPGQYVLICDTTIPLIKGFAYNSDNLNPKLDAVITDASAITEAILTINDELVCNSEEFYDYYDSTTGQFSYSLSKYEDGGYSASIIVTDDFGNKTEEWTDFEIYRESPEILEVMIPETLNPSSEVRVKISSNEELSNVYLNSEYTDDQGNTISQYSKMEEKYDNETGESYYGANFHEIAAGKDVTLWINAYNYYGNCTKSERLTLTTSPISIEIEEVLKNCVSVVCSNKIGFENTKIHAAAYNSEGTLLGVQISSISNNVMFTELPDGAVVKAFLWGDQLAPICKEAIHIVGDEEY